MKKKLLILIPILITIFFLIIFISSLYIINKSLIINFPGNVDEKIKKSFSQSVKESGFRNTISNPKWYDSILYNFYNKIVISEINYKEEIKIENCLTNIPYYASVNNTSEIYRLNKKEINDLYLKFSSNKTDDIKLKKIDQLSLTSRILLEDNTGKPVIFYKAAEFSIINFFNKKLHKKEKKINYKNKPIKKLKILGFTGDVAIEEQVKDSLNKNGFDFSFKEVKDIMQTPDLLSINLEFCVSHRGVREDKHYTFRANEKQFKLITESAVDYAACANNHAMDYGERSLLDTINYLEKYNIYHSGTGKSIYDAFKSSNMQIDNNKLAYFSICEVPVETAGYDTMENFKATKTKAGIAYYNENILKSNFKKEKEKGRLIIVNYHSGLEYVFKPNKVLTKQVKTLIDMGADAVICHHPHVINGVEIYNNKFIAYSLGDYLFDIDRNHADEGIVLYLYIIDNKIITWSFYPTIADYGAVTLNEERIDDVADRFIDLTKKLESKQKK